MANGLLPGQQIKKFSGLAALQIYFYLSARPT
jgi:hypothetical protein